MAATILHSYGNKSAVCWTPEGRKLGPSALFCPLRRKSRKDRPFRRCPPGQGAPIRARRTCHEGLEANREAAAVPRQGCAAGGGTPGGGAAGVRLRGGGRGGDRVLRGLRLLGVHDGGGVRLHAPPGAGGYRSGPPDPQASPLHDGRPCAHACVAAAVPGDQHALRGDEAADGRVLPLGVVRDDGGVLRAADGAALYAPGACAAERPGQGDGFRAEAVPAVRRGADSHDHCP